MNKNMIADPHNKVIRTSNNPSNRTLSSDNLNKRPLLFKNLNQNLAKDVYCF